MLASEERGKHGVERREVGCDAPDVLIALADLKLVKVVYPVLFYPCTPPEQITARVALYRGPYILC